MAEDPKELGKVLDTSAAENDTVLLLDNARRGWRLSTASLDAFATADASSKTRRLGHTASVTVSADTLLIVTGNNVIVESETASRTAEIRLAPEVDTNNATRRFKHRDLRGYVRANRAKIMGALVTILEAKGPKDVSDSGRFKRWAEVVAAPLATASGIDLTARWAELGEDDGGAASDLHEHCIAMVKAQSKMGTKWLTAKEIVSVLTTPLLVQLGVKDGDTETQTAKQASYTLQRDSGLKGYRHGEYVLYGKKANLGQHTSRKARWVFRADHKPRDVQKELPDW
jgi:hypothetical protein